MEDDNSPRYQITEEEYEQSILQAILDAKTFGTGFVIVHASQAEDLQIYAAPVEDQTGRETGK